jgi:histidine phosphotransferase ChpT
MDRSLRLAEAMSARLCHDLSGLAGTVAGMLQLAADEPSAPGDDGMEQSLALAKEAADQLARRLRLLRAAWGPGAAGLDRSSIGALAGGLPPSPAVRADLSRLAPDAALPPGMGRIALNLILLGAEGLPAGGTISVSGDEKTLMVGIEGERAGWPAGLAGCVSDQEAAWALLGTPRGVQTAWTVLLARELGFRVSLLLGAEGRAPPLYLSPAMSV